MLERLRAFWQTYARAIWMVVAAVAGAVVAALTGDQRIDLGEWSNIILAGTAAAVVLTAPGVPGARYVKPVLAVLTALAAPVLLSLLSDGLSWTEAWQLIAAALGALGVGTLPYQSTVRQPAA